MNGIEGEKTVFMRRRKDSSHIFIIFNFNRTDVKIIPPILEGRWDKVLDSSEKIWNGSGSLVACALIPGNEITVRGHSLVMYNMGKPWRSIAATIKSHSVLKQY